MTHTPNNAAEHALRKCLDDCLHDLAERERQDGETVEKALDRLIRDRHPDALFFLNPFQPRDSNR